MDATIVIVIVILLALAAGGGAYAYHTVSRPLAAVRSGGSRPPRGGDSAGTLEPAARPDTARSEPALAEVGGLRAELDRLRSETRATAAEVDSGLARLRERRDAILAEAETLASRVRDELARAENARRSAEAAEAERRRERERPTNGVDGGLLASGVRAERAETLAELYLRLTRVETTLAALTSPILLPGEPYGVPEEFPPEALRWENWKEIGESAYALGDYFHGRRLQLEPVTAQAVTTCLTTLRVALTEQIYPNLKPLPTPEDADALRDGLTRIAEELAAVRARLEADYRNLAGPTAGTGAGAPA